MKIGLIHHGIGRLLKLRGQYSNIEDFFFENHNNIEDRFAYIGKNRSVPIKLRL